MKTFCARVFLIGFLSCFFLSGPVFAQEQAQKWDEAARLYKAGQFAEAAAIYDSLVEEVGLVEKSALYYNLGNCYYRTAQWSQAIWNFERAIALRPWYGDARHNLNEAKAKLEYKIEDRRGIFPKINSVILQWVRVQDLILLGLLSLSVLMVSSVFWVRSALPGPFFSFPRLEMFLLVFFFAVLLGAKVYYERGYQEAIVLAKEAEVRYGPSLSNQSLMKLGGGLKVFIVDEREDWSRVVTWNGETGWIKNSEMGKVKS